MEDDRPRCLSAASESLPDGARSLCDNLPQFVNSAESLPPPRTSPSEQILSRSPVRSSDRKGCNWFSPDSLWQRGFISKNDDLAGIYGTYLRREKNAIESMGYALEGPHRVEPYTEYTLRRMKPPDWRAS